MASVPLRSCILPPMPVLLVIILVACSMEPAQTHTMSRASASTVCGPNAIYLMLAAYGLNPDEETIRRHMPPHPDGLSLAEIRDALAREGLPVQIRRFTKDESAAHGKPHIVLMENPYGGTGHYWFIVGADSDGLRAIDPTTAEDFSVTVERLMKESMGYMIVANIHSDRASMPLGARALAGLGGFIMVGCILWAASRQTRIWRNRQLPL